MTPYVFPNNNVEGGQVLQELLGNFWNNVYDGQDVIAAYTNGLGEIYKQTNINLNELALTFSRFTCPVFHEVNWQPLTINQSTLVNGDIILIGSGLVFGPQPNTDVVYNFGAVQDLAVNYTVSDSTIFEIPVICNRINNPSLTFTENIDYIYLNSLGKIVFNSNPFNNPLIPVTPVYDANGNVIDQQITLWLFKSQVDYQYLYNHFGYAVGIQMTSSQNYKNFLNAYYDSTVGCTSIGSLQRLLSAVCDAPISLQASETVRYITTDAQGQLIITDQNVYRVPFAANVLVSVGQILPQYTELTDTITFYNFSNGTVSSNLSEITVPASYFVNAGVSNPITFVNSLQNTTVTTSGGYTEITFPLVGNSTDITNFWNTVQSNGIASGTTLAMLLDNRTVKTGQPAAGNLPTQINPAQFLAANVFRNNMIYVVIKSENLGTNALGLSALSFLTPVIPTNMALLITTV